MILHAMPNAAASFLARMADAAARALLLGCVAGLALKIWSVKSVSVRLTVWRAVLGVALMMPLLGAFVPAVSIKLPGGVGQRFEGFYKVRSDRSTVGNENKHASHPVKPAGVAQTAEGLTAYANASRENPLLSRSAVSSPGGETPRILQSGEKSGQATRAIAWLITSLRAVPWAVVAMVTYSLITVGFLFRFAVGLILSLRLERGARSIRDPRALGLVSSCARTAGIKRVPRLAESELLSVPVTLGVVRPAILLPSGWCDWDEGELDAVIAHEISHVARRDALVDRLALLHRTLFWFSPLSWYLTGALAELAEEASDEAALAAGADRTRYAETLLGFFSELEAAPGRVWWQGVAMAKAGQAEKRLDRILEWKGSVAMQLKKSVVVVLVMTAVPVVYVAAALRPGTYNFSSIQYSAAQEQESAPPPAPAAPTPAPTPTPDPTAIVVAPLPNVSPLPQYPRVVSVAPLVSVEPVVTLAPMRVVTPVHVVAVAPLVRIGQSSHSGSTVIVRGTQGDGQQFVISSGKTYVSVSGDSESFGMDRPSEFVEFLQEKIQGDFIWFRHDGKSYVIRDQATIKRAVDFFSQVHAIEQKQEELGKQQEALGEQQEALGKEQEGIRVEIPDMTEDLHKLEAELKALGKTGSEEDLGRIQEKIGDLQSKLGDLQSKAGEAQGKLGEKQGALGEKQGKLGEQEGELSRQEEQIFRDASRQMKSLIDDALAHGLAKPE
jgi:beta-lactamase regulating signal transducer with metallopeptidase domain